MDVFAIALSLINQTGITLAVGASTFALTFYVRALEDGTIDLSEKRFMHTVYVVLRIGMITIIVSELAFVMLALMTSTTALLFSALFWFKWILLAVIISNAVLMQLHKMPMRFGPTLAGGSWYSYFIVSALGITFSLVGYFVFYVIFLVVFWLVFEAVKKRFIPPPPTTSA